MAYPPAADHRTEIKRFREMQETVMLGLRLLQEGVSGDRFEERFDVPMSEVFGNEISEFEEKGLLEWVAGRDSTLKLTERGYLLGNQVFSAFV